MAEEKQLKDFPIEDVALWIFLEHAFIENIENSNWKSLTEVEKWVYRRAATMMQKVPEDMYPSIRVRLENPELRNISCRQWPSHILKQCNLQRNFQKQTSDVA